jgi:hypothetical protein
MTPKVAGACRSPEQAPIEVHTMFFGSETFAYFHVAISLVAIGSGFIVAFGMVADKRLDRWTAFFLATTLLTSATGFLFPFSGFTPAHGVGIFSLVMLAVAAYARYIRKLVGWWRLSYVIGAVVSLYLNFFVLVVQAFQKVPALHTTAPQGNEPPFAIAQLVTLIAFVVVGCFAARRFK